ncbi:MAG: tyrosine--tRNA ligase [Nanoarchaeota archaeon]|nr:tyrosine--tRNA ligase [Nanoarchaeota archaeon]
MDIDKKLNLIKRNTEEIIGEDELKKLIKGKKQISVYWGTMPTGSISIAYFFPMLKIADFLKAGLKVKILLADLHAELDGVPWDLVEKRYDYYKRVIINILKIIGVDIKKLEFVRGKDFQLKPRYMADLLKLSTITSITDATKSASEAVKTARGDVKVSGIIYPLMQALDEEFLGVDIQFAGTDQRKIMVYAREFLPKIGYKKRIEIMNPMIRGLVGKQMSSSIESTKIDLLNTEDEVKRKINNAECVSGNPDNGIMALLKYLIFIIKDNKELIIERPEKYGGNLVYKNYKELEKDFVSKKLHPLDLKNAVAKEINSLLREFRKDKKLKELHQEAYS